MQRYATDADVAMTSINVMNEVEWNLGQRPLLRAHLMDDIYIP